MGVKSGSQMISFLQIGSCRRMGSRSSAACWFSAVQQMVTLGYPVPQSGGKQAATRNKRLVMIKIASPNESESLPRYPVASCRLPARKSRNSDRCRRVHRSAVILVCLVSVASGEQRQLFSARWCCCVHALHRCDRHSNFGSQHYILCSRARDSK